ncbi:MAG: hypothetical protein K1X61_14805 [Chitinophagales bacterium]|nr:hypothetical protein [Chitinophagales bacterium]
MNNLFTLLFLTIIISAFGQTSSKNCVCPESQIKAYNKPDTIFYLQNGTPISFCGYKFQDTHPTVYLKFVLAFCLPDTLLDIDIWNANQSCYIHTIGDTLLVDEIAAKLTEKIYLNGLEVIRKKVKTKTVTADKKETPIKIVDRIFKNYIKLSESTDSPTNKDAMKNALQFLQTESDVKDLPLLINVWMYYDPTDFPTRQLIQKIFAKDKKATLSAIDNRLNKKKKWENKETAPYSDLVALKNELKK